MPLSEEGAAAAALAAAAACMYRGMDRRRTMLSVTGTCDSGRPWGVQAQSRL